MILLSQNDPRWKDIKLGTSNLDVEGYAEKNLVIWAKIEEAFPGIKVRRVWSYDNNDVKNNLPCIVEVDGQPIGGDRHFVVYVGNQKLYDPWDGHIDPTSDYPNPLSYCVLSGSSVAQPEVVDLAECERIKKLNSENEESIKQKDVIIKELNDEVQILKDEKVELQKANISLLAEKEALASAASQDAIHDRDAEIRNLDLEKQVGELKKEKIAEVEPVIDHYEN